MVIDQAKMERAELAKQEAYWKQALHCDLPCFNFHDHPRPPAPSFLKKRESTNVNARLFQGLESFCLREGVKPSVVLLAVLNTLLLRYTDQGDLIIGSLFSDAVRERDGYRREYFTNFVFLDALPLTPNGKVDSRALPIPDNSRPELGEVFVAPRTPVEKALAGIWAEILGVERVGIHDNFFELGGHSLSVTQVISRAREALQIEFPVRHLFENPTVAVSAARIAEMRAKKVLPEKMAGVLAAVESLSDEEARRLLARESSTED